MKASTIHAKASTGDALQEGYFIIDSFEALLEDTLSHDFAALYAELADQPELDIARRDC